MIKVCYRLWVIDDFISKLPREQNDLMYGIDEDCNTKKEWKQLAKSYTDSFNEKFGTNYTIEDFFGTCEDIGWRRCTKCGDTFWSDEGHECEW